MTLTVSHNTDLLPGSTFAKLPAVTTGNRLALVNDIGPAGFGSLWISDGTRWRLLGGRQVIAMLGAAVGSIANSETVVMQTAAALPAGSWQTNDVLRLSFTVNKSGTTDALTGNVRIGTAGTTGDTAVVSATTILAAANRSGTFQFDIKLVSATSAQRVGVATTAQVSATAEVAAVTISSAATAALFVSFTILSSSTNDTVGITSGQIELITG
jgi:hypothetical protein